MRRSPTFFAVMIVLSVSVLAGCGARESDLSPAPSAQAPDQTSSPEPEHVDDEFDGTSLDTGLWRRESGTGYGIEHFTASPQYADVTDGMLRLTARRDGQGHWRSGEVTTRGHFAMTSGTIEIRARLPRAPGAWPAFWMHNSIFGEAGPPHAEIDIMELFPLGPGGASTDVFSLHDWSSGQDEGTRRVSPVDVTDGQFHTWKLVLTTSSVSVSIDGRPQAELTRASFTEGRWVFNDKPLYLILGLSVHQMGIAAQVPDEMQLDVDFVRMQRTSS